MSEIWKPIKDYENEYMISNLGRVAKILKPNDDGKGYLKIGLSKKGNKYKTPRIHQLIAQAFIPNKNNYSIINHKDGNKRNNNISNLEWCTQQHNIKEAYRLGFKKGISAEHKGDKNPNSKLTVPEVISILEYKNNGYKIKDVYEKYKTQISFSGFEQIWYGYKWKYLVEKVSDGNK